MAGWDSSLETPKMKKKRVDQEDADAHDARVSAFAWLGKLVSRAHRYVYGKLRVHTHFED